MNVKFLNLQAKREKKLLGISEKLRKKQGFVSSNKWNKIVSPVSNASIAQMVERKILNLEVVGSIPAGGVFTVVFFVLRTTIVFCQQTSFVVICLDRRVLEDLEKFLVGEEFQLRNQRKFFLLGSMHGSYLHQRQLKEK